MAYRACIRIALIAATALLVLLPGSASAVEGQPDVVEDPPVVVDPVVDPAPEQPTDDVTVQDDPVVVDAAGVADATIDPLPTESAVAAPRAVATSYAGSLPFTGSDPRQLAALFLAGVVCIGAGLSCFRGPGASAKSITP